MINMGPAHQHRRHQRQHLATRTGSSDTTTQTYHLVQQPFQPQPGHQRAHYQQSRIRNQPPVIEHHPQPINIIIRYAVHNKCLLCPGNSYIWLLLFPRSERHFTTLTPTLPPNHRWIQAKTAVDAARAVGCQPSEIVKSFVFEVDGETVLALVPGDRRLQPVKLAEAAGGQRARRASLDRIKEATGFAAGGTPPFGHARPLRVFADRALRHHDLVWAAADTPTTVFPIGLADLDRMAAPGWFDLSCIHRGASLGTIFTT